MANLKVYNESTGQWEYLVVGKQGPTGPQGSSGVVNTTSPITNSGTSTSAVLGLDYDALSYGRNYIINGAFDIWQRGTSFTGLTNTLYSADRWYVESDGSANVTREALTPAEITAFGFGDITYAAKYVPVSGTVVHGLDQHIEDVRTLAGQTVTVSFWAKASAATTFSVLIAQMFGSGGSSAVGPAGQNVSLTTSWQRFSTTFTLGSIAGKTIGANSSLWVRLLSLTNNGATFYITGVQLEAGSVATPFKRHAPSLQGELAACQRYYYKWVEGPDKSMGMGSYYTISNAAIEVSFPVTMRVAPTLDATGGFNYYDLLTKGAAFESLTISRATTNGCHLFTSTLSVSGTVGETFRARAFATASSVAFNAEL